MSDEPKQPITSTFAPLVMTGMGSSAIGDQLGDAFSQLIAWVIAVQCGCVPPDKVMSAVHTISVSFVVFCAYMIHYYVLKRRDNT